MSGEREGEGMSRENELGKFCNLLALQNIGSGDNEQTLFVDKRW